MLNFCQNNTVVDDSEDDPVGGTGQESDASQMDRTPRLSSMNESSVDDNVKLDGAQSLSKSGAQNMRRGEVGESPSANNTQGGGIAEHDEDSTGSVRLSITDSHSNAIDFVAIGMYCDYKLSSVTLRQRHKESRESLSMLEGLSTI